MGSQDLRSLLQSSTELLSGVRPHRTRPTCRARRGRLRSPSCVLVLPTAWCPALDLPLTLLQKPLHTLKHHGPDSLRPLPPRSWTRSSCSRCNAMWASWRSCLAS
jgi:hypothetical protein